MDQKLQGERIEKVRAYVDQTLLQMTDAVERRCAYVHLYGVAQACALIARKRNEHVELAIIAGMLHDLFSYKMMDSSDHARQGAAMAKEILEELDLFDEQEISLICDAICRHSGKAEAHTGLTEVLIDADVWQHCAYNPFLPVKEAEKERCERLKKEFGLP